MIDNKKEDQPYFINLYGDYNKMIKIFCTIFLLLLLSQSKLVHLSELFRHGARYPVSDIYDGNETKAHHGVLTGIGMRQHYLLGSYLRRDYSGQNGLFNSTFNPRQVEIFSDIRSQRCYYSAYAHAAGLFSLDNGQILPTGISQELLTPPFEFSSQSSLNIESNFENGEFALNRGYQPVPIKEGFAYFPSCPNENELIAERVLQIVGPAGILQIQQAVFCEKMKNIFGIPATLGNIAGMAQLYDVVICDLNLGRKMPPSFTQQQFLQMKFIQNYMFALLYSGQLARVFSTPIASALIDTMNKVISGTYDDKKLTIISGHDTNVAPMLTFLNLTTPQCLKRKFKNQTVTGNCAEPVPFASNIQFQLHKKDSVTPDKEKDPSSYYVKIRYNGDYYHLCEGSSLQCQFKEFSARIDRQLVNFNRACGTK